MARILGSFMSTLRFGRLEVSRPMSEENQRRKRKRSLSGTPSISAITVSGRGSAKSATRSTVSAIGRQPSIQQLADQLVHARLELGDVFGREGVAHEGAQAPVLRPHRRRASCGRAA